MSPRRRRVALTIAGSDSGGGAGVAADLKTFEAHGVWGALAVTAVTAQNTLGVQAIESVSPELVRAQIASVVSDLGVDAAKTGMLGSAEVVEAVAEAVVQFGLGPLVVDPVMVASQGERLLAPDALEAVRDLLLPLATVITPNLAEAEALLGDGTRITDRSAMEQAALELAGLGPDVVMVTGGHLGETSPERAPGSVAGSVAGLVPDCVALGGDSSATLWLEGPRLGSGRTHGTGCVLSAAICAELARGMEPADACTAAKHFVEKAIAAGVALGAGVGPVDPGWAARDRSWEAV